MKNSSRFPKPVQECVNKVNEWIENNKVEYDCDPYVFKDEGPFGWEKRPAVYVIGSNYEDGFSSIVYDPRKDKWFVREYMSEREDIPVTIYKPWDTIIGIMAG